MDQFVQTVLTAGGNRFVSPRLQSLHHSGAAAGVEHRQLQGRTPIPSTPLVCPATGGTISRFFTEALPSSELVTRAVPRGAAGGMTRSQVRRITAQMSSTV